jgi:hypothetical protein
VEISGEKWLANFAVPQICDMDKRLYFPSEGRHAEDIFALKNPTASANLGTRDQHANHKTTEGTTGQHANH